MLLFLVLNVYLQCSTQVINKTPYPYNAHDKEVLQNAKLACSFRNKNKPCVVLFKKVREKGYIVICGKKVKESSTKVKH